MRSDFEGETKDRCQQLTNLEKKLSQKEENIDRKRSKEQITMIPGKCLNYDGVTIDGLNLGDLSASLGGTVVTEGESLVESLHAYAGGDGQGR